MHPTGERLTVVFSLLAATITASGCVGHGTILNMHVDSESHSVQGEAIAEAERVVSEVARSMGMREDRYIEERRAYSTRYEDHPYSVTQSYEHTTNDDGVWVIVYLTTGIDKVSGDFVASIYHSQPLIKSEFARSLHETLTLELQRDFPSARIDATPTRMLFLLGP